MKTTLTIFFLATLFCSFTTIFAEDIDETIYQTSMKNTIDCDIIMNNYCSEFVEGAIYRVYQPLYFQMKTEVEKQGFFPIDTSWEGEKKFGSSNAEMVLYLHYVKSSKIKKLFLKDKNMSGIKVLEKQYLEEKLELAFDNNLKLNLVTYPDKSQLLQKVFFCREFDGLKRLMKGCSGIPRNLKVIFNDESDKVLKLEFAD